ncbi:uncharacterized protein ASCRUDRAFT_81084 [Ascoidea rubescens DSM 1968]|uniref:Uncharacterized protein n=1 Tax=Ascoidea rubescens DSM 1968 TaxID=1344418 RepID=A0A1D2VGU5_9ASCO|nr:hypothetical protein ASCRUDRAFT_81084 [Ascoidea rubescens DSM 1968]ODV60697.1 hypothetical protein ASCRUDRAFT_81084 [Ascoidea rubescens DSM 1968]
MNELKRKKIISSLESNNEDFYHDDLYEFTNNNLENREKVKFPNQNQHKNQHQYQHQNHDHDHSKTEILKSQNEKIENIETKSLIEKENIEISSHENQCEYNGYETKVDEVKYKNQRLIEGKEEIEPEFLKKAKNEEIPDGNFNELNNSKNLKSMTEKKSTGNTRNTRNIRNTRNTRNTSNTSNTKNTKNTKNTENTENTFKVNIKNQNMVNDMISENKNQEKRMINKKEKLINKAKKEMIYGENKHGDTGDKNDDLGKYINKKNHIEMENKDKNVIFSSEWKRKMIKLKIFKDKVREKIMFKRLSRARKLKEIGLDENEIKSRQALRKKRIKTFNVSDEEIMMNQHLILKAELALNKRMEKLGALGSIESMKLSQSIKHATKVNSRIRRIRMEIKRKSEIKRQLYIKSTWNKRVRLSKLTMAKFREESKIINLNDIMILKRMFFDLKEREEFFMKGNKKFNTFLLNYFLASSLNMDRSRFGFERAMWKIETMDTEKLGIDLELDKESYKYLIRGAYGNKDLQFLVSILMYYFQNRIPDGLNYIDYYFIVGIVHCNLEKVGGLKDNSRKAIGGILEEFDRRFGTAEEDRMFQLKCRDICRKLGIV